MQETSGKTRGRSGSLSTDVSWEVSLTYWMKGTGPALPESIWEEGRRDRVVPRALTLCPQVSSHSKCVA